MTSRNTKSNQITDDTPLTWFTTQTRSPIQSQRGEFGQITCLGDTQQPNYKIIFIGMTLTIFSSQSHFLSMD